MSYRKFKVISGYNGDTVYTTNSAKLAIEIAEQHEGWIETNTGVYKSLEYFSSKFSTTRVRVKKERMQAIALGIYFMNRGNADDFETPYTEHTARRGRKRRAVFDSSENFEYGEFILLFQCINGVYYIEYQNGEYSWCEFVDLALSL